MADEKNPSLPQTARFLEVIGELRKKCPWDKQQTHQSLRKYLIEETYEAIEAIDEKDIQGLMEELGDVLLQVALHAQIAHESHSPFDFEYIAGKIADKMVRRHPHVFGPSSSVTVEEVKANWKKIKAQENPQRMLLDGVPEALPALLQAHKYGEKTRSVGFDWKTVEGVVDKVGEELEELCQELQLTERSPARLEEELGDLLFSVAQLARHLELDAEMCLKKANQKFKRRFTKMEEKAQEQKRDLSTMSEVELEAIWGQIKSTEPC